MDFIVDYPYTSSEGEEEEERDEAKEEENGDNESGEEMLAIEDEIPLRNSIRKRQIPHVEGNWPTLVYIRGKHVTH